MSRLEEIKRAYNYPHNNKNGYPYWLISRVEELEEENRKLNHEIGKYSGDIHEMSRNIINECTELRLVAKKMLKGESDD